MYGMEWNLTIVKTFRVFIGKSIINGYWIVSVFRIYFGSRIVKTLFKKEIYIKKDGKWLLDSMNIWDSKFVWDVIWL